MSVQTSIVDSYQEYGRCLKLENGSLEILITIDVGPRIIFFGAPKGENMFFNDKKQERVTKGELFETIFGKGAEYHFYGGHRMWLAPQLMLHTCVPDNRPVAYKLVENGVILMPEAQKVPGMQPEMTIIMDPEQAEITVDVCYKNISREEKRYAVWQISQFDIGGVAFIPFSEPHRQPEPGHVPTQQELLTPLKPNGQITSFLGNFANDPRCSLDSQFITLRQDPEISSPIKIGTPNHMGYAMYANKGYVTTIRFQHDDTKIYTDWGCSFETYTDAAFLELESLGAFETVKPGQSIAHRERLELQKMKQPLPDLDDREAVAAFVEAHRK